MLPTGYPDRAGELLGGVWPEASVNMDAQV